METKAKIKERLWKAAYMHGREIKEPPIIELPNWLRKKNGRRRTAKRNPTE